MDRIGIGILAGLLLAAAWHDIKSHRIPNLLILAGLFAGLLLRAWLEAWPGVVVALEGCAVGLAVLLPFYVLRILGAGDVKLMAMVGAFLGPWGVLGALLGTFLAGGILALAVALRVKAVDRLLQNMKLMARGRRARMSEGLVPSVDGLPASVGKLPYAVAIAAGTLGYLVWRQMR